MWSFEKSYVEGHIHSRLKSLHKLPPQAKSGKITLVFDLMEEFRPIIVGRPLIAAFRRDYRQFEKLKDEDHKAIRNVKS